MIDRMNYEPLYLQIKNDIIQRIESGEIKIGDKLMSENEMLRFYSVGRVTIRAALAELVSEGCVRKEHGLGSFCVAYPKQNKINVDVLVDSTALFSPYLLKGISHVLEQNMCNLLLHDTGNSLERIKRLLEGIIKNSSDGVILQPSTTDAFDDEFYHLMGEIEKVGIPVVIICGQSGNMNCSSLSIDDFYGAYLAVSYLLECGHKKILGLYTNNQFGTRTRYSGFEKALSNVQDSQKYVIWTEENYEEDLIRLIREENITAIQCCNDYVAADCIRLCSENNISVPDDVSVIGFDDVEISLCTTPQLTTIAHPKDHMGSDAAKTLLMQIRSGAPSTGNVIYRPELVIRQSVRDIRQSMES